MRLPLPLHCQAWAAASTPVSPKALGQQVQQISCQVPGERPCHPHIFRHCTLFRTHLTSTLGLQTLGLQTLGLLTLNHPVRPPVSCHTAAQDEVLLAGGDDVDVLSCTCCLLQDQTCPSCWSLLDWLT